MGFNRDIEVAPNGSLETVETSFPTSTVEEDTSMPPALVGFFAQLQSAGGRLPGASSDSSGH